MNTAKSAASEFKPGLAIGGGMLAGFVTLALVTGVFWVLGRSAEAEETATQTGDKLGSVVGASELKSGDCVTRRPGSSVDQYQLVACDSPHQAQIIVVSVNPSTGAAYPGDEFFADWIVDECQSASEDFLGLPLLETTLVIRADVPSADEWTAGTVNAVCYLEQMDSTSLEKSLKDAGADHLRGTRVPVSRLLIGDCFIPGEGTEAYDLNSNSDTTLVPCDGDHNGVFFGRARLDLGPSTPFPGQEEVGAITSELCAELFADTYGVSAEGFNYRYWRPNQASWDAGDRSVLCAILDVEPLTEDFNPQLHRRFFNLDVGDCFNLGPEETSDTLRLDDQVRLIDCSESHIGQMIGSGNLDADESVVFPGDEEVLRFAAVECEQLFEGFVGISPFESQYRLNSPIWYPNGQGWEEGDRRYACAYLGDEASTNTLEDAKS